MRKSALLLAPFLMMSSANAGQIHSIITDSVQLTVEGPALQSTRIGATYSVSGSNISASSLGGVGANCTSITAGSYSVTNDGQAFTFSESGMAGDAIVTSQTAMTSDGRIDTPNLYSDTITNLGGTAGNLAGTLTTTGVGTVTAGGPGTSGTLQRTIELTVFN